MHYDLRRLDLNLLLVFDALVRHRSVTLAADELAMSASAVSHALARLRDALADELFVRIGNEMRPTAAAERIMRPVGDALDLLHAGLAPARRFDPASSERTFTFAATDYTAFAMLPAFIARMQEVAPSLRFRIVASRGRESAEELASGRIDFALGYEEEALALPAGVESVDGFSDDYVVIASRQHPTIRRKLSMAQYLAAQHVVVTPWDDSRGAIDRVLNRLGVVRHVAVQLPAVLVAPFIVARSNLLMTVPRHAALILRDAAPVTIYPAPFDVPRYTLKLYQHTRHAGTPAHVWVRDQLLRSAHAIGQQGEIR
ncbi:LysR family transcriptional regulator [Burkholderia sp. 22PA0099]|uniref:LysR family transcriptional regulator n=1 Tax=Burkholderia sp. 22PA0099 TaxID=3237372 RepID=UPI0039C2B16A